jgi:glycerol-3-phosphate dehydrogenase
MFVSPWRDHTLVGVWHHVYRGDPDCFEVTDDQLRSYLAQMNQLYPAWELTLDDISLCHAGLVPFGDNPEGAEDLRFGRHSHLIDHAPEHGIENLVTLIGVRYTTARCDAARAIDVVYQKLGLTAPGCQTAGSPVAGGDIDDIAGYLDQITGSANLDASVLRGLVFNYGTECEQILASIDPVPQGARRVGNSHTILAQVAHAVRQEMAQNLGDVVFRRTDLATGAYPGRGALEPCAALLAEEFGWDAARIEREIEAVASRFPARAVRRVESQASGVGSEASVVGANGS